MTDHRCQRCGTELKVVEVRVAVSPLVTIPHDMTIGEFLEGVRYETREDVSDCHRCTGSY